MDFIIWAISVMVAWSALGVLLFRILGVKLSRKHPPVATDVLKARHRKAPIGNGGQGNG